MPVRSVGRESILPGTVNSDTVMYKGNVKKLKATIIRIEKQRRRKKNRIKFELEGGVKPLQILYQRKRILVYVYYH